MNLKDLYALVERGIATLVSTRDTSHRPEICEGLGLRISEDGTRFSIFISDIDTERTKANLNEIGILAVTFASPFNYQAAQIKGRLLKIRPMDARDLEHHRAWRERYLMEIEMTGVMPEASRAIQIRPTTVLEAELTELFLQTPGPGAGEKIR